MKRNQEQKLIRSDVQRRTTINPIMQIRPIKSSKMYPFSIGQVTNFIELSYTCLVNKKVGQQVLGIQVTAGYRKLKIVKKPIEQQSFKQNSQFSNEQQSRESAQDQQENFIIVLVLLVDGLCGKEDQPYPIMYAPYSVYKNLKDLNHSSLQQQLSSNPSFQQAQLPKKIFVKIQRFPISYGKNYRVESVDEEAQKITITKIRLPTNQQQSTELKDLITKITVHPKFSLKSKTKSKEPLNSDFGSQFEFLIFPQSKSRKVFVDCQWLQQCNFLKHLNKQSLKIKTKLLQLRKQNEKNQLGETNSFKNYIEFCIGTQPKQIKPTTGDNKVYIVRFVPGKTQIQFTDRNQIYGESLQVFSRTINLSPIYQTIYSDSSFYRNLKQKFVSDFTSEQDHLVCLKSDKSIGLSSFFNHFSQQCLNKRFININCQHFALQKEFFDRLKKVAENGSCFVFIKNIQWLEILSKNEDIVQETIKSLIQKIYNSIKQGYSSSLSHFTCVLYISHTSIPEQLPKNTKRLTHQLEKQEKLNLIEKLFTHFQQKNVIINHGIKQTITNMLVNSIGWTKIYKFIERLKKQIQKLTEKEVTKLIQKQFSMENVENVADVSWSDIGGLQTAKQEIIQTVLLPTKHPEIFDEWIRPRTGLLFYGPPGTGKTLLGKCIAKQCKMGFISVKGPELLNMYVGESEKNVRQVFERAKQSKPCIVFMDELDALVPKRGNSSDGNAVMDRIVAQLLMQIDMASQNQVFVIGATNRPDLLDPSILRAGRFDKQIYLGISKNVDDRVKILKAQTRNSQLEKNFNFDSIVEKVPQNFTGADFYGLTSKAMMRAVQRSIQSYQKGEQSDPEVLITQQDFMDVLPFVKPSVSEQQLQHYESLKQKFS